MVSPIQRDIERTEPRRGRLVASLAAMISFLRDFVIVECSTVSSGVEPPGWYGGVGYPDILTLLVQHPCFAQGLIDNVIPCIIGICIRRL